MAHQNHQGQILIEVCLVMFFLALTLFIAANHLADLKTSPHKYQLTEDSSYANKNSYRRKK